MISRPPAMPPGEGGGGGGGGGEGERERERERESTYRCKQHLPYLLMFAYDQLSRPGIFPDKAKIHKGRQGMGGKGVDSDAVTLYWSCALCKRNFDQEHTHIFAN